MTGRLVGVSLGWLGISMVTDGVPAVLLPHQLLSAGRGDATALGFITLVAIALAAAIQPLAGRWSDIIGRWPVIATGVASAVVGLVLMLSPATAMPGAVLALLGASVAQAGHQPLLPDLVPRAWRGRASGIKSALDVSGAIIGFLLLAMLLGGGASGGAVLLLAVALGVPFLAARLLLPRPPRRPRTRGSLRDAYRLGASLPPGLVPLVAARFFFLLGIYAVGRFLLLFVADRLGLDADAAAAQAGLALAALALVTVIASLPAGWLADRLGRRRLMLAGGGLAALGMALLPGAGSIELVLAFGALMALGTAAFSAGSWAALADVTASPESGRLLAIANYGTAGAAAAAGAFGLLIDAGNAVGPGLGYVAAFEVAAACALAGGVLAWRLSVPGAVHARVEAY